MLSRKYIQCTRKQDLNRVVRGGFPFPPFLSPQGHSLASLESRHQEGMTAASASLPDGAVLVLALLLQLENPLLQPVNDLPREGSLAE